MLFTLGRNIHTHNVRVTVVEGVLRSFTSVKVAIPHSKNTVPGLKITKVKVPRYYQLNVVNILKKYVKSTIFTSEM